MGCLGQSSLVPELIVMWNASLSSFRSVHRPLHQQEGSLLREVQPRWGQTKPVCRRDVGQEDRPGMKREPSVLIKGSPLVYMMRTLVYDSLFHAPRHKHTNTHTHTAAVMKIYTPHCPSQKPFFIYIYYYNYYYYI